MHVIKSIKLLLPKKKVLNSRKNIELFMIKVTHIIMIIK